MWMLLLLQCITYIHACIHTYTYICMHTYITGAVSRHESDQPHLQIWPSAVTLIQICPQTELENTCQCNDNYMISASAFKVCPGPHLAMIENFSLAEIHVFRPDVKTPAYSTTSVAWDWSLFAKKQSVCIVYTNDLIVAVWEDLFPERIKQGKAKQINSGSTILVRCPEKEHATEDLAKQILQLACLFSSSPQ